MTRSSIDGMKTVSAEATSQFTILEGLGAALAVLKHPIVSDAGGLLREQLDTLTRGSGFSFGDLAADRVGKLVFT